MDFFVRQSKKRFQFDSWIFVIGKAWVKFYSKEHIGICD